MRAKEARRWTIGAVVFVAVMLYPVVLPDGWPIWQRLLVGGAAMGLLMFAVHAAFAKWWGVSMELWRAKRLD